MWCLAGLFLLVSLKDLVSGAVKGSHDGGSKVPETTNMTVVSHVVNLDLPTAEENELKDTYAEVHTYSKLNVDLRASLGSSFTICSTVSSPVPAKLVFFSLLNHKGDFLLSAGFYTEFIGAELTPALQVLDQYWWSKPILAPVFPQQWVRSCLAVSTKSGRVQWVVGGRLVEDRMVETLKETDANMPRDLSGKVLLGVSKHYYNNKWHTVDRDTNAPSKTDTLASLGLLFLFA